MVMQRGRSSFLVVVAFISCSASACTSTTRSTAAFGSSANGGVLAGGLTAPPTGLGAPLPTLKVTAMQICADARVGAVASASSTTVGAVRAIEGGHGVRPQPLLPHALRPAPNSAQAAWCWTVSAPDAWTAYLASPGVAPEHVGDLSGQTDPPVGQYPFR
jgi:hypothetical protein